MDDREKAYEEGRRDAEARYEAAAAARRAEYAEGIVGEGWCGAVAPNLMHVTTDDETPVFCRREAGHPLGKGNRHKAVYGEPHVAVSWEDELDANS